MDKEKMFNLYDTIISVTMYNIKMFSNGKDICLKNFNVNNPEHRYILRIALYCRDFQNCDLKIVAKRKEIRKINKLIGKNFTKIKRGKLNESNVNVPSLLELERVYGTCFIGKSFRFSDILNEYYSEFMRRDK